MTSKEKIAGVHAVYEALVSGVRTIERIHLARRGSGGRITEIIDLAKSRGVPVRHESRQTLDRLSAGSAHQGVVAVVGARSYVPIESLLALNDALLVVLDGVEDPQNLGSVIRTAETAGASGVVVPERRSAPLSPAVSRASSGALEHVRIARVRNLVAAVKAMKRNGIWVVAVDPAAPAEWTEFDYTVPVALVFGGEHRGIRPLVRRNCDAQVSLPMEGRVESLNVSVAVGVVLYEAWRQRKAGRRITARIGEG